jgi:hypothetical protein
VATKLLRSKLPLPKFRSDEEAAEYFETHSIAQIWDKLPEVKAPKLSMKLERAIRDRHVAAKSVISVRSDAERIAAPTNCGHKVASRAEPTCGSGSPQKSEKNRKAELVDPSAAPAGNRS